MGIAVVIGGMLVAIIINSAGLYSKESSKLSEGLNTNNILSTIRATIKQSSGIIASQSLGGVSYTTGSTKIVLKLSSIDTSNNLIENTYDYFIFYSDTNKLRLKTFPDGQSSRKSQDQIFSTSVNNLTFQYFNSANPPVEVIPNLATTVRLTLSLKQNNGPLVEVKTSTSEARLRND